MVCIKEKMFGLIGTISLVERLVPNECQKID